MVTKALNIFPTSLVLLEGTLSTFKVRGEGIQSFGKGDMLVVVAVGGGSQ